MVNVGATIVNMTLATLVAADQFPPLKLAREAPWGLAPLALVIAAVGWRTFHYAKLVGEHRSSGARGILEAGGGGLAAAVVVLIPGILTRPTDAPPYVLFYGGAGFLVGALLGAVFWGSARLTLWLLSPRSRTTS